MLPTSIATAIAMSRTEERISFAEVRRTRAERRSTALPGRPVRRVGGAR